MKQLTIFLIFLSIQSIFAETPAELTKLRSLRESEINKINSSYVKALEKLKTKYTKKGDLPSAIIIDKEIKEFSKKAIKDNPNINNESKPNKVNFNIEGNWVVHSGNRKSNRSFTKHHMIDEHGTRHNYNIVDGILTIDWRTSGGWEKLELNHKSPDLLLGTNNENKNFFYKRQK
jgi:hypothetical protein